MWKVEERKEEVPAPITLPPLDEHLQAELHQRYEEAGDAETRTRYQMIVLAQSGVPACAWVCLQATDLDVTTQS